MKSLLANVTKDQVIAEPFPHVVVRDALDDETCLRLITEFPSVETVTKGKEYASNERFSYGAADSLEDPKVSPLWREFVGAHVSPEFLQQQLFLFGDHIRAAYPSFERDFGALDAQRPGVRNRDSLDTADALMDAQICVNTPVVGAPSSVRRGHLDLPDKLFAGLFYLRLPDDDSTGGDLELYRYKNTKSSQFNGQFIDDKFLETVSTVKYERNVLVLFLNSLDALHGVSVRSTTAAPRCFLNLVTQVRRPLFDLKPHQKKWWKLG